MKNDIRRLWGVAAAALMVWSLASLSASGARAADETPAGDVEASAEPGDAVAVRPEEIQTLRQRVEAAESQIQLLKGIVIQALRAQTAAEEALQREREARDLAPGAGPDAAGSRDLTLAEHLEALTESLTLLREDVAALRAEVRGDPGRAGEAGQGDQSSALEVIEPAAGADPMADSGVGGAYDPLVEDQSAAFAADDAVEMGLVYFDSGSADLTPGAERKVLEAAERIKAMEPARVRVVGYADRVGDAGYNEQLSAQRARTTAMVLARVGMPGDAIEVIGSGEEGIPVPTADQISEPLNRIATIFVVMDSPK